MSLESRHTYRNALIHLLFRTFYKISYKHIHKHELIYRYLTSPLCLGNINYIIKSHVVLLKRTKSMDYITISIFTVNNTFYMSFISQILK